MRRGVYAIVVAAAVSTAVPAEAAVTIDFTQSGPNVVAVTSGTFDFTGLTLVDTVMVLQGVTPNTGSFSSHNTGSLHRYSGLTGPTSFGTGGFLIALSASGDPLYLSPTEGLVGLEMVISGAISATTSWSNQTFASMGLTAGSYVYSTPADTITINIGPADAAVPEASTWAMMLMGFGAIGFAMRRKRKGQFANG